MQMPVSASLPPVAPAPYRQHAHAPHLAPQRGEQQGTYVYIQSSGATEKSRRSARLARTGLGVRTAACVRSCACAHCCCCTRVFSAAELGKGKAHLDHAAVAFVTASAPAMRSPAVRPAPIIVLFGRGLSAITAVVVRALPAVPIAPAAPVPTRVWHTCRRSEREARGAAEEGRGGQREPERASERGQRPDVRPGPALAGKQ